VEQVSGLALWQWRSQAEAAAIATAVSVRELDWLLLELTGLDRLSLRLGSYKNQASVDLNLPFEQLQTLWQQRLEYRIPVQYLVGHTHWRNFTLQVSPAVLVPRPETEQMIDLAQQAIQTNPWLATGHWVDLGTGSGAIAIALADLLPQARIHAVDLSPIALQIAKTNARQLGFGERITFYEGSWFGPIAHLQGKVAGLVSNPPYIPTQTVQTLQPEVRDHEPHMALDGGDDGLDAMRILVKQGRQFLQPGAAWMVEMMAGQGESLRQLLQDSHYQRIQIVNDFAGHDRFAFAYTDG
jgi:release factor glutamine methyltransferase